MNCRDKRNYYDEFIRRGSAELRGTVKKADNRGYRNFMKRVILMRVYQG